MIKKIKGLDIFKVKRNQSIRELSPDALAAVVLLWLLRGT